MNGDTFYETFYKVYGESDDRLHVFKLAHSMLVLGEAAASEGRRVIGLGITPDTFIGIRLCSDGSFYLRETDSEIMYDCEKNKLFAYRENDWAKNLFHILGRLCGSINISGAQVLFHKECGADFANYAAAVCYGFSKIFCSDITAAEILSMILPGNADFAENARQLLSLDSQKGRFSLIENRVPVYIFPGMDDYMTVLALTGEKAFADPIKRAEQSGMTDEIKAFEEEENRRVTVGAALLKKGDTEGFGRIVKKSAEEYLELAQKHSEKVKMLFKCAAALSDICGIYENRGIFSFVHKDVVDEFVDTLGAEYEKKAGTKPEFYICAPSASETVRQEKES